MNPLVTVSIVTCNSRPFLGLCLEAVRAQDYRPLEIIIVDNASTDGTAGLLAEYESSVRVIRNRANTGFSAAQNQAIRASRGDWILTLNPDVRMLPGFIGGLVEAASLDRRAGVVCGKLLRATANLGVPAQPRIDSAGIYFSPNLRHFDRGWNEPDDGRYSETEYVFGASAAAALYRRAMIEDVSLEDGFFDPDFFAYREDADVAWRAQLLGWRAIYIPTAVAYHVRRVVPGSRRMVPALLRMHSVKNRFLMRAKNLTGGVWRRQWLPTLSRDLVIAGGCLLTEPTSLPAFWHAARHLPGALAKRRQIMARRRASDDYLAAWFHDSPVSRPLELAAASAQGD